MRLKKTKICGIYALCTVLVFSILFSGCGKKNAGETETGLFYLNQEKTRIVKEEYEPEAEDTEGLIEEYLGKISEETGSVDYRKVFPDKVKIERYEFEKNQLYLYFNKAYQEMTASEEVLCRGAIVHTMMQIDGVNGVSFYVDNLPLTDARGQTVGIMTNDSFVENPGEKINNIQTADLVLYFASKDGSGLVSESQHVHYSSNTSMEKLVMERLLEGPKSENAQAAIPTGTELINVSVMDGVCLVNFNDGFLTHNFNIREDVVIYSIVDSLTELPTIDKVQISVNGETNINYRENMPLKDYYTRNLDLATEKGEEVEVNQKNEKEGLIDTGK